MTVATLFDRILVERIRAGLETQRAEAAEEAAHGRLLAGELYRPVFEPEEPSKPMMLLEDVARGYDALSANIMGFLAAGERITAADCAGIASGLAAALRQRGDLPELPAPPAAPTSLGLHAVLANLQEMHDMLAQDEGMTPLRIRLEFAIQELSLLTN